MNFFIFFTNKMRRFFPKICIPRTLENELVIKQVIPGTVLSILFGVALSCYLIMEMQTNNQLLSLNVKLKTLKFGGWRVE